MSLFTAIYFILLINIDDVAIARLFIHKSHLILKEMYLILYIWVTFDFNFYIYNIYIDRILKEILK